MKRSRIAIPIFLTIASAADAATLTITPDKQVYQVGEQITLNVLGDSEGGTDNAILGRILFDPSLATYVSSTQVPLTSFGGGLIWILGVLVGGAGFGDAFNQIAGEPERADAPLKAVVIISATAPGTLTYTWQPGGPLGGPYGLDFFELTSAPGGSVTIVPEPGTGLLLVLGLLGLPFVRRSQ
jgi:hypothetical protein